MEEVKQETMEVIEVPAPAKPKKEKSPASELRALKKDHKTLTEEHQQLQAEYQNIWEDMQELKKAAEFQENYYRAAWTNIADLLKSLQNTIQIMTVGGTK